MSERRKRILILMLASGAAVILYIFLHELGHCVVALACGARITEFSIITAHMSSEGGRFTDFRSMMLNCNGALFPYLIGLVWMAASGAARGGRFYKSLSFFYFTAAMYSVLPWIFIPITFIRGYAPAGDDVTKFLITFTSSGRNPLIVTAAALLALIFNIALMMRKETALDFIDYLSGRDAPEDKES